MAFYLLMSLSSPLTWIVIMMVITAWKSAFRRPERTPDDEARIVRSEPATPEGIGAALIFLSVAYRPNHAFVAKAQIVQREDTDDDDQGGPDTAQRHLMRQLRRIRRGEPVDRLVWRLE